MGKKNKTARAAIIGGAAALVSCFALTGCDENTINYSEVVDGHTMEFDVGEHTISVPISFKDDVRSGNVQYNYYPGYEPVAISLTAYGRIFDNFNGGAIVYSNVDEVECKANYVDENGNYLFLDFGTPIDVTYDENESRNGIKEFDVGEHIISTPLSIDVSDKKYRYEYHEGYEIVGVATTAFGDLFGEFSGGVILYKNVVPVKCIQDVNGYTTFGIPFEKGVSLNKSMN